MIEPKLLIIGFCIIEIIILLAVLIISYKAGKLDGQLDFIEEQSKRGMGDE